MKINRERATRVGELVDAAWDTFNAATVDQRAARDSQLDKAASKAEAAEAAFKMAQDEYKAAMNEYAETTMVVWDTFDAATVDQRAARSAAIDAAWAMFDVETE